ncbi:potassium channel family protein [Paraburkholderia sp. 22B1P]|uniref:potassium channel family protein n=1 Tax=Paraburkholderia sp. 22B1P TaxID=3080498 RepID=UPI003085C008|nr:potassium channel family protein [Paraburkholderia sp. 22B1P]
MSTNISYPAPASLWGMPPHVFNEWRATNDIPVLFQYLATLLPGFDEWIATLPFGRDVMMRMVPTGDLFKGQKAKVALERSGDHDDRVFECYERTDEDPIAYWKKRNKSAKVLGSFEPYFGWVKRTRGRKRFFTFAVANRSRSDDFIYGSWTGISRMGVPTSARLFRSFTVLKLGQVTLPAGVQLAPRNLDFVDLDFLEINGDFHGAYWLNINYSSCRELSFKSCEFAFCTLHKCATQKIIFEDSKVQDFYFENTDIQELRMSNTYAFRLGFKGSRITPFIKGCELKEVSFVPARDARPSDVATTYRLLRSAFQESGMRREAAESYYRERVFERKALYRPYLEDTVRLNFPPMGTDFKTLFRSWYSGLLSSEDIRPIARRTVASHLKAWFIPKYALQFYSYRVRWLISLTESLVWGYGERPSRILMFALMVISACAGTFHVINWGEKTPPGWIDSAYFSVVTFTTLGYGDILPTTTALKLLCGSEAILGAFTMGLIVAGFSNRSRY